MSAIEWTDETWNPVVGCTAVSSGCANCYAATMAVRLDGMGKPQYVGLTTPKTPGKRRGWSGRVNLVEKALEEPLRRKKPTRYFIASMGDLFHEDVPFAYIDRVFAVMALCPQHVFQVLTKRPERMAEYLRQLERVASEHEATISGSFNALDVINIRWVRSDRKPSGIGTWLPGRSIHDRSDRWPLPNVWLGTSVEDQKTADLRIPHLLRCPAAVRFLSCEPLQGPVDLVVSISENVPGRDVLAYIDPGDPEPSTAWDKIALDGIHWVIAGGESGPGARPCNVWWIESIVEQCERADVPVFVKQLGAKPYTFAEDKSWPTEWPPHVELVVGEPARAHDRYVLRDAKGGDPSEWPARLRVREMPRACPDALRVGEMKRGAGL